MVSAIERGRLMDSLFAIVITILVSLGILFMAREIVCWYWKINLINSKLDRMISLLEAIASNTEPSE